MERKINNKGWLIVSADERTWEVQLPVIFLGEWCKKFSRKKVWERMELFTCSPYGVEGFEKERDQKWARAIELKVFAKLCALLNEYHNESHGEDYWKIILGHWLRRFIDVMINRVQTLDTAIKNYQIEGVTLYSDEKFSFATKDSYSSIWSFNDDLWNMVLTKFILENHKKVNFRIEVIDQPQKNILMFTLPEATTTFKYKTYLNLSNFINFLFKPLLKRQTGLIIQSFLPAFEEVKLKLHMRLFPLGDLHRPLQIKQEPNLQSRGLLTNSLAEFMPCEDLTESLIIKLVFQAMPVCFLEGYQQIKREVSELSWPDNPKFIFTSNCFDTDELFKVWTASKREIGCKYIVGQHGNNYGTRRFINPTIEEETPDKFLTWGWDDGTPNKFACFVLKNSGLKELSANKLGGMLLVQLHSGQRINTWDDVYEFERYFQDQIKFVENLAKDPRGNLTIRLHNIYKQLHGEEDLRWGSYDNRIKLSLGDSSIRKLICNNRIVVHCYDSTGILETLSDNMPTIAFWHGGLDYLNDDAKPYYQKLVEVGIVHFCPESAANQINLIWGDVDSWWSSFRVQEAINYFCSRYAHKDNKGYLTLKDFFLKMI